jgi:hypothetical protein
VEQIFLNFRTGDQDMAAPFLHRYLVGRFGAGTVFFSSHSIPAGAHFPDELGRHAEECQVLLALIGPRWLTMAGPDGQTLLSDPDDWVRREIAVALAAGRVVIPVLVANAPRLAVPGLPADLASLASLEYRYLRRRDLEGDLRILEQDLIKLIPGLQLEPSPVSAADVLAEVVVNRGYVAAMRVNSVRTRGGQLAHQLGPASVRVHHNDQGGIVISHDVGEWDRLEPSAATVPGDAQEEWGNAGREGGSQPGITA